MDFLNTINFDLVFKIGIIAFLCFFTLITFLLFRQLSLLNRFLNTVLGGFLSFLALLFLGTAIGALVLSFLIL